jgi:prepilin-type N-terminal cleavage/methylation domain-containing protein
MTSPLPDRRGFTILELLVATAVMALFLVLSSQVVSSSLSQWGFANDRMSANLQARLAFDWLARDLQSLCLADDGSEWLRIMPSDPELPDKTTDAHGHAMKGSWLMCYTQPAQPHKDPTSAGGSKISGPVAVSYSLGYLDPMVHNGSRRQFALLRTSVNPRDTFENMGVGNLYTDFWKQDVLGFTTIRPEDILADNVVGFRVVAEFLPAGAATPVRSDPSREFSVGPDGAIHANGNTHPGATLTAFEITLWLLDTKSAARMNSGGANLADSATGFTKRIPILAK